MRTDVAGRVKNIGLSANRPLMPLYEAIVNSVQAIQDADRVEGQVLVEVMRDEAHLFAEENPELGEIVGFNITDNGIGFNDENYRAFETSDTRYKEQIGGKGVGRFLWLVAFDQAEITSDFEHAGRVIRRSFRFLQTGEGISDFAESESPVASASTTVSLLGFKPKFQQNCPKRIETLAVHLIEHCLQYFIREDCPRIVLSDRSAGESLNLNELFHQQMVQQSDRAEVKIADATLYLLHVRLYSTHALDHQVHYCAHNRVVKSERLHGRLPYLSKRLKDQAGRDFVYAGYVDGELLDDWVNADRTDFGIAEERAALMPESVSWREIRAAVYESAQSFLKPYTGPLREQTRRKIEDFVASEAPAYRPILNHIENKLDRIDPDATKETIDLQLYQAYQEFQSEVREEGQRLLQDEGGDEEWETFVSRWDDLFEKIGDINKSDLARYVTHRRAILDFLYKQLTRTPLGDYRREDRIHRIIFPQRRTSDDVTFESHNLWLVDEKLVYHAFLASDQPLRKNPQVKLDSDERPDIVVFDKAIALTGSQELPYSSITIVEFKRPMRTVGQDDNPFVQIRKYVDTIRSGTARTPEGRDIPLGSSTPFFCFLICDITPALAELAGDFELTKTPDEQGFYGWKKNMNAYVEVVSYTKMVDDARKRNAVFFDKLGLPSAAPEPLLQDGGVSAN